MAFTSGTAAGVEDFLAKFSLFVLANGWELIRGTPASEVTETWFTWRAPGFDIARRPFVHMKGYSNTSSLTDHIELRVTSANDNAVSPDALASGAPASSFTPMSLIGFDYWIYLDDLRALCVFKNTGSDYSTLLGGFFQPFALPIEYPFPIIQAGNHDIRRTLNTLTGTYAHVFDPVRLSSWVRRSDNIWRRITNKEASITNGKPLSDASQFEVFVHPFITGMVVQNIASNRWPNAILQRELDPFHAFERFLPTAQGELPLMTLSLVDNDLGVLGFIQECFAIPSGGVLAPEQVISVGALNYRVFPSRDQRSGKDFVAVREF